MFISDRPDPWIHGIWFHRQHLPALALSDRGHATRLVSIGQRLTPELLEWPDTVIFGRIYPQHFNPIKMMKEFQDAGKRVLYDMDDDFWNVAKDNPSAVVSNALKDQYEGMIRQADACITPSPILAKRFKKEFKKQTFICPNTADAPLYLPRPKKNEALRIGYMGAASHWKDLQIIVDVINELSKKYDFVFTIYGLTGEPFEAAIYHYRRSLNSNLFPEKNAYFTEALAYADKLDNIHFEHVPFMPPELHPTILSQCDFDIGLAPLEDKPFNRCKSNVKFYEYASVGTVTLASDVEPYTQEVDYRAKNTHKDWYKKLEKLIVDKDFREKLLAKQQDWVKKNRSFAAVGLDWELACQRPGGLKVAAQQR